MSDVRKVKFRDLTDAEDAPVSLARPHWLSAKAGSLRPAPFAMLGTHAPDEAPDMAADPVPYTDPKPSDSAQAAPAPVRRGSSLPPRKSLLPPAHISRLPPPHVPSEAPPSSAEREAFAEAALDLAAARARALSRVESELLELALHIAETIIEREVEADAQLYSAFARAAVRALGDTQAARLRVSRLAYRAISELFGEPAIDVDGVRVEVFLDNSLDALDVVAEAGPSRVDGRFKERLLAMLKALEAEHRRNNAELASEEEL